MCLIELSIGMEALVFSLFLVCSGKPASLGFVFKSLPQHYMCFIFPTFALAPFLKTKESIHFFFYFLVLERERETCSSNHGGSSGIACAPISSPHFLLFYTSMELVLPCLYIIHSHFETHNALRLLALHDKS